MRKALSACVAVGVVAVLAGALRGEVTDERVLQAIQKAREYLINQQQPVGSFGAKGNLGAGPSALAFMTLAYMGEHPNRDVMSKGMDFLMRCDADRDFAGKQGYAVPIRVMGLSYVHNKLLGEKRALVRQQMLADLLRIRVGQAGSGGWRYTLAGGGDWDFSVTQWPILAMREASLVGVEFPADCLLKARDLYYSKQNPDGGWHYQGRGDSYGSMTAAGLASVYIISDVLEPGSGCPCRGGQSQQTASEADRRIDAALDWLSKNFDAGSNPKASGAFTRFHLYWLYCVEPVGIAAGYKYFGTHNWYKEGVEALLSRQKPDGSWSDLPNTCFATLFLYKGRAPVLFEKLEFKGDWNMHRRDLANLTNYIERAKEQLFHWQIVNLRVPVEELHDAPILYITAETVPEFADEKGKMQQGFSPEQVQKLRAFTDTGGTILVEASCGSPAVRRWFPTFAKQVWPEWPLLRLEAEHGVWSADTPMKQKPELLGADDGLRTFLLYAPDDVSCAWQTKAFTAKKYLFDWGINLYSYATDKGALRAKLAGREPKPSDAYAGPVKAGPRTTLRIARVRHGGDWSTGANYRGFERLAKDLKAKAAVTLEVTEPSAVPFTEGGVATKDLAGYDVAYLAGAKALVLAPDEQEALKAFVAGGGFVWIEAVRGASAFDASVKEFAQAMGWELKLLPPSHGLMTGRMDPAQGYNLTSGVQFRRALRVRRLGRGYAEFVGVFDGERMVGLYSPFDVLFGLQPYEAWDISGYQAADAAAVATNLVLYLTTQGSPTPPVAAPPSAEPPPAAAPEPAAPAGG